MGPDPPPCVIPPPRDCGGCSGGATVPGDELSPGSPSLGRWYGEPWPHGLSLADPNPNPFALQRPGPAPQIPWGKGQDPASLPEKLWWCPGSGLWRWAARGVCLEHPLPGSSTGPGGDQEGPSSTGWEDWGGIIAQGQERRCCVGPAGTWLENQEGHHRRARRDVVARSGGMLLHGAGGTRRDHHRGAGRTRGASLLGARRDIAGEPGGTSPQGQVEPGEPGGTVRDKASGRWGCCHMGPGETSSEAQKTPGGPLSQSRLEPGGTLSPGGST